MARNIPILDLKVQYRNIKSMMEDAVLKVMSSGQYILGPELHAFEREFAFYLKTQDAVGVNSGTDALYLSLKALGIKEGDEVITTPSTFIATAEAIVDLGAKPVFIDVREQDSNMDPELIEQAITKNTKARQGILLKNFDPCS